MRAVWFTSERLGISVRYANPEEFSKLQQNWRLLLSDKTLRVGKNHSARRRYVIYRKIESDACIKSIRSVVM